MLDSEVKNDFYVITWDNAEPANSRGMLLSLKRLGRVEDVHAKTTVKLFPFKTTSFGHVRRVVRTNLHIRKGRAVVVNVSARHLSHMDNSVVRGKWYRV